MVHSVHESTSGCAGKTVPTRAIPVVRSKNTRFSKCPHLHPYLCLDLRTFSVRTDTGVARIGPDSRPFPGQMS